MQEITQFIFKESDWIIVVFACIFSQGLALFYTLFLSFFYKEIKPNWLLFALFPAIIVVLKFFKVYAFFIIIALFILLIVLVMMGAIVKGLKGLNKAIQKRSKKEKKSKIYLDLLKNILLVIGIFAGFGFFGPVFIVLIIATFLIIDKISPSSKNRFLSLQASLPTSRIQSMAMGLVEVNGSTIMQEPLISRIGEKQCIGYRYKTERKSTSNDGKSGYTTISDEVVCNDFLLKDATGQTTVIANNIDFLWVEEDDSYTSGSKRYTQYLLVDNQNVFLIGKANSKGSKTFIEKENLKDIFVLAPYNAVVNWNRNKPLLNSFLAYLAVLFLIIAFVLIAEISVTEETLDFKFNLSWDKITNIFN